MSTPSDEPKLATHLHLTILKDWCTYQIPRSVEAFAQWLREHPAPDEKPSKEENSKELIWLGTPSANASRYGSVKFSPRRGFDLESTDGFFFDIDGAAAADDALDASIEWLDKHELAYVFSSSHSGSYHIQLLADAPCPAHEHERLWKYIHDAGFPKVDRRQHSPARGRNAPRRDCEIQVFPGKLVPVQAWLSLCPPAPTPTAAPSITTSDMQLTEQDDEIIKLLSAVWQKGAVGDAAWGALGGVLYRAGVSWDRAARLANKLADAVKADHPDPEARVEQAYDELHQMGYPSLLGALQKNGVGLQGPEGFPEGAIEALCYRARALMYASTGRVLIPEAGEALSMSDEPEDVDQPEPLVPELAPFPLNALPPAYRDMVAGLQEEHRAPMELGGALVLAAMHAAVQRRFVANPHGHWREELASYTAVVLPPGSSKSPVFKAVMRPIMSLQLTLQSQAKPLVIADETERKIIQKQIEVLEREACKDNMYNEAGTLNSAPLDQEITGPVQRLTMKKIALEQRPVVRMPLLVCQQSTAEALIKDLRECGRLACLTPEGSDIFSSMVGMYSDKDELSSVWLSAYDGEDTGRATLSRGIEIAQRPVLSICITTQPSVLSSIMGKEQFRGRGMLARFTWVVPNDTGPRWAPGEMSRPIPDDVLEAYDQAMRGLWSLGTDGDDPTVLHFSPEAQAVILRIRDEVEQAIQPGGELSEVRDWASKHRARVARVAAVLHLAWGNPSGVAISGETAERAALVGVWMASHATKAFGMRQGNPLAADLLSFIRAQGEKGTTQRDLLRKFHRRLPGGAPELERLLQQVLLPRRVIQISSGAKGSTRIKCAESELWVRLPEN